MQFKTFFRAIIVVSVLVGLMAACVPATESPTPETAATEAPPPTFTPTPVPPRVLTICLGAEPNTLYINDNPNAAALSVMQAIYDGPMDWVQYENAPVILTQRPCFENGAARFVTLQVKKGDMIVEAEGMASDRG